MLNNETPARGLPSVGHCLAPRPSLPSAPFEAMPDILLLADLVAVVARAGPASRRTTLLSSTSSSSSVDWAACTRLPVELAASSQRAIVPQTSVSVPRDRQLETVMGQEQAAAVAVASVVACAGRASSPVVSDRTEALLLPRAS